MEDNNAGVAVETETHTKVKSTGKQKEFKPGHKRKGSDVIDSIGEELVFTEGYRRTRGKLDVQVDFQSTRRKSSDVVDCIGDKYSEVNNTETKMTEINKGVGGGERPTTLDMKPTVSMEWNTEEQAWARPDGFSKEVTDATPSTPLEQSDSYNNESR
jgi:hypothetical protein